MDRQPLLPLVAARVPPLAVVAVALGMILAVLLVVVFVVAQAAALIMAAW